MEKIRRPKKNRTLKKSETPLSEQGDTFWRTEQTGLNKSFTPSYLVLGKKASFYPFPNANRFTVRAKTTLGPFWEITRVSNWCKSKLGRSPGLRMGARQMMNIVWRFHLEPSCHLKARLLSPPLRRWEKEKSPPYIKGQFLSPRRKQKIVSFVDFLRKNTKIERYLVRYHKLILQILKS